MFGVNSRLLRAAVPARTFLFAKCRLKSQIAKDFLIDVATLNKAIGQNLKELRLLDATWYMPTDKRKGSTEYKKETIPK